jgi:hypothetical protein
MHKERIKNISYKKSLHLWGMLCQIMKQCKKSLVRITNSWTKSFVQLFMVEEVMLRMFRILFWIIYRTFKLVALILLI